MNDPHRHAGAATFIVVTPAGTRVPVTTWVTRTSPSSAPARASCRRAAAPSPSATPGRAGRCRPSGSSSPHLAGRGARHGDGDGQGLLARLDQPRNHDARLRRLIRPTPPAVRPPPEPGLFQPNGPWLRAAGTGNRPALAAAESSSVLREHAGDVGGHRRGEVGRVPPGGGRAGRSEYLGAGPRGPATGPRRRGRRRWTRCPAGDAPGRGRAPGTGRAMGTGRHSPRPTVPRCDGAPHAAGCGPPTASRRRRYLSASISAHQPRNAHSRT